MDPLKLTMALVHHPECFVTKRYLRCEKTGVTMGNNKQYQNYNTTDTSVQLRIKNGNVENSIR